MTTATKSCVHRSALVLGLALVAATAFGQAVAEPRADGSGRSGAAAVEQSPESGSSLHRFAFRDVPYYEPLRAEPRAARNMIMFPAWAK